MSATPSSDFRNDAGEQIHVRIRKPGRPPLEKGEKRRAERARGIQHLVDRDGPLCWLCGAPLNGDATLDHVLPKSKGGSNSRENLRLAHRHCNAKRGNQDAPA